MSQSSDDGRDRCELNEEIENAKKSKKKKSKPVPERMESLLPATTVDGTHQEDKHNYGRTLLKRLTNGLKECKKYDRWNCWK